MSSKVWHILNEHFQIVLTLCQIGENSPKSGHTGREPFSSYAAGILIRSAIPSSMDPSVPYRSAGARFKSQRLFQFIVENDTLFILGT